MGRRIADVAGHAKVCDLESAAVVEKQVGGFEIAVENPIIVEVGDARGKLGEECFDFASEEGLWHVFEDGFEVMFEKVEDEEDAEKATRN